MVATSQYSSNKSKRSTINPLFRAGVNSSTYALHRLTSADILASTLYVKKNGVSHVNFFGVIRFAHRMLGSSSAHLPFVSSSLFFNPFIIALLVASACPLL